MKLTAENIGENYSDLEFVRDFLNTTQKTLIVKDKSNIWTSLKSKLLLSQSSVKKMKKQARLGENICKLHI